MDKPPKAQWIYSQKATSTTMLSPPCHTDVMTLCSACSVLLRGPGLLHGGLPQAHLLQAGQQVVSTGRGRGLHQTQSPPTEICLRRR